MIVKGNKTPNILWICTDQQRFDSLGCYGNSFVKTPNIDKLAQNGFQFNNAFCQSPVCTPSRASFLTGRYPRTTRCRENGQEIPEDETLIPKILRDEAGYYSGLSGKLHLSPCDPEVTPDTERRIDDGYDEFYWSHNPRPGCSGNQYRQWLESEGKEFITPPFEGSKHVEKGMSPEYHQSKWCTDHAVSFIKVRETDNKPWLFSVNIYDPHHPFDPPEEYLRPYLDRLDDIPLPDYVEGELDNKPYFQQLPIEMHYHFKEMSESEHRMVKAAYWAMIDNIDAQVGRLIETLEKTGQLENTMVIFTSDHGEMLGDHGIYLKGPYFYEQAVKVPLIISMPGTVKQGLKSDALVELVDLVPTIIESIGLQEDQTIQGRSLWKMLTGSSDPGSHRDSVYCEYYKALKCHEDPSAYATMVRNNRYKIVRIHGLGEGELYDLKKDPGEIHNCWDNKEYSEVKTVMLELMCDRMAWTIDPKPLRKAWW